MANIARILGRPNAYIIFGVDANTHAPIGTTFTPNKQKAKGNADLIPWLTAKLWWLAEFEFHEHLCYRPGVKILLCSIEQAKISPVLFDGTAYIRIDSHTKPIKADKVLEKKLWSALLESSFESDMAIKSIELEKVKELMDWEEYMEIMDYLPKNESEGIKKLEQDGLIIFRDWKFDITNAGALLFARNLEDFGLKSKLPRVITYRGINKLHTISDIKWSKGYCIAFRWLIAFIKSQVPKIETIVGPTRITETMYPEVAIREFVANAMIHQDFRSAWSEVLIEIFDDRIEISNPGTPLIDIDRFIDHPPKSRNEKIADFMRRANHCERRWSGVDRALNAIQNQKLPIPKIERNDDFTRVILYRLRPISRLTNNDKARSIYWHCALQFVLTNTPMTNESVCERFWIQEQNKAEASRLIKITKELGYIKSFDPLSNSRKHAKYIPFWAS